MPHRTRSQCANRGERLVQTGQEPGSFLPAHIALLLLTGVPSALNLGSSPTPSTQHPTPLPPSPSFFPSGRGIPCPTATPPAAGCIAPPQSQPRCPIHPACRLRRVCPIWVGPARAGAANNGPASPQRRQPRSHYTPHCLVPCSRVSCPRHV